MQFLSNPDIFFVQSDYRLNCARIKLYCCFCSFVLFFCSFVALVMLKKNDIYSIMS